MRIHFQRTGGFAGRKLEGILDSSALPPAQVRQLRELLRQSHFFDKPSEIEPQAPGADRFSYKITVEYNNRRHTVEAMEGSVPGEMRPLLDFLTRSFFRS